LRQVALFAKASKLAKYRQKLSNQCAESCIPAVFVVSNGRTGSTSIVHMLNLIPGYDIKGEMANMWGDIYAMHVARNNQWQNYGSSSLYAWSRSSAGRNDTELLCSLQMMVLGELNAHPEARVVGFKDVHWGFDIGLKDVDLLMEVFPCAKVILSYREDIEGQLRAKMKTLGDFDYYYDEMATKAIKKFASKSSERTFALALEDFSLERFNELLRFLGEDADCEYVEMAHDTESGSVIPPGPLKTDAIKCTGWSYQRARSTP